jgi:hypothetical protein
MNARHPAALVAWFASMAVALALSWLRAYEEAPTYSSFGYVEPVANLDRDPVEESRLADLRVCMDLHGPNVAVVYLPDGQHRCTNKHGRSMATVAHEVQP